MKLGVVVIVLLVAGTYSYPQKYFTHQNEFDNEFEKEKEDETYSFLINKLRRKHEELEPRRVERTAYLHLKSREKDKRYANYLTLCHFKICNMGRKRTTRYFHLMSTLDDTT